MQTKQWPTENAPSFSLISFFGLNELRWLGVALTHPSHAMVKSFSNEGNIYTILIEQTFIDDNPGRPVMVETEYIYDDDLVAIISYSQKKENKINSKGEYTDFYKTNGDGLSFSIPLTVKIMLFDDGKITDDQQQIIERESINIGKVASNSELKIKTTSSTPIFDLDTAAYKQNPPKSNDDIVNGLDVEQIVKLIQDKLSHLNSIEFDYTTTNYATENKNASAKLKPLTGMYIVNGTMIYNRSAIDNGSDASIYAYDNNFSQYGDKKHGSISFSKDYNAFYRSGLDGILGLDILRKLVTQLYKLNGWEIAAINKDSNNTYTMKFERKRYDFPYELWTNFSETIQFNTEHVLVTKAQYFLDKAQLGTFTVDKTAVVKDHKGHSITFPVQSKKNYAGMSLPQTFTIIPSSIIIGRNYPISQFQLPFNKKSRLFDLDAPDYGKVDTPAPHVTAPVPETASVSPALRDYINDNVQASTPWQNLMLFGLFIAIVLAVIIVPRVRH
ncbi:hypothetical protein JD969_11195 [Planctomycetota bacterium]|nr:hypothetical protein JD969_11195 [Planctomycetota bacterium]